MSNRIIDRKSGLPLIEIKHPDIIMFLGQMPFLDLRVLGRDEALELCEKEPKKWCVVSIWTNPLGYINDDAYLTSAKDELFKNAKKVSQYHFHDITEQSKYPNAVLCSKKDIISILKFAKENIGENLIVHCAAGISRSSAIAFLILLDQFKDKYKDAPLAALEIVYKARPQMYPNLHIMELGIDLIARSKEEKIAWFREIYNSRTWQRIRG